MVSSVQLNCYLLKNICYLLAVRSGAYLTPLSSMSACILFLSVMIFALDSIIGSPVCFLMNLG
jgi:hypothetical protein